MSTLGPWAAVTVLAPCLGACAVGGSAPAPAEPPRVTASELAAPVDGVRILFDGRFEVGEGLWWLADTTTYDVDRAPGPSFRRLLESDRSDAVMLTVPNADGGYRARIELYDVAPVEPAWCEDLAEASLRIAPDGALEMDTYGPPAFLVRIEPGWYRVRYCTELQDRAADEDAVITERPATYSGRHLLQLWAAPRQTDRTLRSGSAFARSLTG